MRAGLQRVVDHDALQFFSDGADESVVDALGYDQTRGRRATLAGREEGAVDGAIHRNRQIGVVQHDKRVLAAHFELELAIVLDRGRRDALARAARARKSEGLYVGAIEQRLSDHRTLAHDEVQDAVRQAGALEYVDDGPGAAGHQIGRLDDDRVAVAERRRDLPGRMASGNSAA